MVQFKNGIVFRGSNGTFIVGIKQNEVKSTKAFNFNTSLA